MTQTALYRHFDAQGTLLYVGISIAPIRRLQQHEDRSSWVHQIARMEVEWHATKAEAETAEWHAVQTEKPVQNILKTAPRTAHTTGASAIHAMIGRWESRKALADEVGAPLESVHKWAQSGRIPSEWQFSVVKAAEKRGLAGVTAEWMLEVHSVFAKPSSARAV